MLSPAEKRWKIFGAVLFALTVAYLTALYFIPGEVQSRHGVIIPVFGLMVIGVFQFGLYMFFHPEMFAELKWLKRFKMTKNWYGSSYY